MSGLVFNGDIEDAILSLVEQKKMLLIFVLCFSLAISRLDEPLLCFLKCYSQFWPSSDFVANFPSTKSVWIDLGESKIIELVLVS